MRKLLPADVRKWLCVVVTGIIISSVFAGLGIVSVSADPGPTRSIVPDSVAQGESVDVTIAFKTLKDFTFLSLVDRVPIGWNVTDMRANDDSIAAAEAFSKMSNTTIGMVLFAWIGIGSGIDVQVDYTLHVPLDAEPGEYNLTGKLSGYYFPEGAIEPVEWNTTLPNGTVVVELSYGVNLSVDEEEKTTDAEVNATYYLIVENTGAATDTYGLSITSTEADFARLNKSSVSLGAGESEVVELNVSDYSSGSYNTTVRAASTDASDEITVTTVVRAVRGVDLKVEGGDYANKTVEPNETASYTLTVKNTGSDSDSYELEVSNKSNADTAVLDRYMVPNLAAGASANVVLNVSDAEEGEYVVNVTATSQGNVSVNDRVMTKTVIDTTPPASITNLQYTNGSTWISWTWTNPGDADFSHVMVYLNGTWQKNTSAEYYTATGLNPDTEYEIGTRTVDNVGNINATWVNNTARTTRIFDTGSGTYPSISGTHNGTIKPNVTIEVSTLYTYPCPGTGGHTEYARIWNETSGLNATATWNGYGGGWHKIVFNPSFTLIANETYNYTIRTGSYPQIHHESTLPTANGWINCTDFTDANGRVHYDWIPAFKLYF